jgi:hypothetical protein
LGHFFEIDILLDAVNQILFALELALFYIFFTAEAHNLGNLLQWYSVKKELKQFLTVTAQ